MGGFMNFLGWGCGNAKLNRNLQNGRISRMNANIFVSQKREKEKKSKMLLLANLPAKAGA